MPYRASLSSRRFSVNYPTLLFSSNKTASIISSWFTARYSKPGINRKKLSKEGWDEQEEKKQKKRIAGVTCLQFAAMGMIWLKGRFDFFGFRGLFRGVLFRSGGGFSCRLRRGVLRCNGFRFLGGLEDTLNRLGPFFHDQGLRLG